MPTLALTDFNIVVSVLGGWVSLFGLVSYLCKEKFYLSEACKLPLPQTADISQHRTLIPILTPYSDFSFSWRSIFSIGSQFYSTS